MADTTPLAAGSVPDGQDKIDELGLPDLKAPTIGGPEAKTGFWARRVKESPFSKGRANMATLGTILDDTKDLPVEREPTIRTTKVRRKHQQ